jgi:serine/threonine-protein kinase RsbW
MSKDTHIALKRATLFEGFQHIDRGGDCTAMGITDQVVPENTVRGFKAGSDRARQVTTIFGATSIRAIAGSRARTGLPSRGWHMKTFLPPTASNGQERKLGQRRGLLLMMALHSDPKWLSIVRGAVEPLTETLGFSPEQRRAIIRAVDEALANIVRHSYRNRVDKPIAVYFRTAQRGSEEEVQHGLEIILCDRGPASDVTKWRGRPLDEIRPGGLGLHLIQDAMDIVEFSRKGHINRLRLVKYLGKQTAV